MKFDNAIYTIISEFAFTNEEMTDELLYEGRGLNLSLIDCRNRLELWLRYLKMKDPSFPWSTYEEELCGASNFYFHKEKGTDLWDLKDEIQRFNEKLQKEIETYGDRKLREGDTMNQIVEYFWQDTRCLIEEVLHDNIEDPERSAITCRNYINAYLLYQYRENPNSRMKTYSEQLSDIGYSEQQIALFNEMLRSEIERWGDRSTFNYSTSD